MYDQEEDWNLQTIVLMTCKLICLNIVDNIYKKREAYCQVVIILNTTYAHAEFNILHVSFQIKQLALVAANLLLITQ